MTPIPVRSQTANQLAQLVDTLGQAGQLAGQFGQIKRHQDLEAKQAEAEQERINAKAEVFDRGTAAQQVLEQAPIWQEQIATKKLPVPTNPDDIPAWAAQFAEAHVDPNAPPAQRDEYLKRAKAHLTSFAAHQALIDSNQATSDLAQAAKDSTLGTTDGAVLSKGVAALTALGYSETDAVGGIGGAALEYAAKSGNQAAFDTAQAFLGDRFKEKQQAAEAVLNANLSRAEAQNAADSQSAMYGLINDRINDPIGGPSWDSIRDHINAETKSGVLPEHIAHTLIESVASRQAAEQKVLDKAVILQEGADKRSQVMLHVSSQMDLAAQGMGYGAATIPDDGYKFTLSDGTTTVHMTKAEIVTATTDAAIARINQQYASDPARAFVEQVKYVGNNGIDYDPWKSVLRAGPQAAILASGGDDGKGQMVPMPQNALDGWKLYNSIGKIDHTLAMRLAGTTENAQFYETTRVALKHVTNGDAGAALVLASTAHRREAFRDTTAEQLDRIKAMQAIGDIAPGALNAGDARVTLGQVARLYMGIKGMDAKTAVTEAAETLRGQYDVVGGYWVRTLNTVMPPKDKMDAIVSFIKSDYIKAHPDFGLNPNQLALVPDESGDYWTLWNNVLRKPVDDPRNHGIYYNTDLLRAAQSVETASKEHIITIQKLRNQPEPWQMMLSPKYGGVARQVPKGQP